MKNRIFGRHHIRANAYHLIATIFLIACVIYYGIQDQPFGWFDVTCSVCFLIDYIMEMYDPHPESPGTWFTYFHRAYDGDDT